MPPGLGGVFQPLKKAHFRVPVTHSQLPSWEPPVYSHGPIGP